MKNRWFDVDKTGLAKMLERRGGKVFIIHELFQNAWDEPIKRVDAVMKPVPNAPRCQLRVTDDSPEGFRNLDHAYTLFAESYKRFDADKAGRFNLGEKLVLAFCNSATIVTTKGTIRFLPNGKRQESRAARDAGTEFCADISLTRAEYDDICERISLLLPPRNIVTTFNGEEIPHREPLVVFEETLPTEIADPEGNLKSTRRKTIIEVYEVGPDETAMLFERGIPVVETGDRYHVNVMQKVPLPMDRDSVRPSCLKAIRTYVLNHTFDLLKDEDDASEKWVSDALSDKNVSHAAVQKVITKRFGDNAVSNDLSDPEGTSISMSQGRQVVFGGTFNKEQWNNIRKAGALPAAGQVTPSPKPFSANGRLLKTIDPSKWTKPQQRVVRYIRELAIKLMNVDVQVDIANDFQWRFVACYGPDGNKAGHLTLNIARLGRKFFNQFPQNLREVNELMIHEFGHQYSGNHLSSEYHDALSRLGALLGELALNEPEFFSEA